VSNHEGSKPSKQTADRLAGFLDFKSEIDPDLLAAYNKASTIDGRIELLLIMILRTLKKK
jgi:hypothetical protein